MKNNEVYFILLKYKSLLFALLLLFVTVVVLQVNYNKNKMHNHSVDEYFTITSIHPQITPDKTMHRALNGPRMFTYLFYPGAIVGMISHMGGNIYEDGWDYPGHNYFVKNYALAGVNLGNNMKDPNLRYFHYYLKLQAVIFMFLSFVPLVFLLWKKRYFLGMFMVAGLIGINFLSLEERSIFYIEPLLMSMMNLLIWLYFYISSKRGITWFWVVFSAFLFALTISLKFSALFMIGLISALIVLKFKTLEKRISAGFLLVLSSLLFFCLINWNIFYSKEVFNVVVHDYLSNFWQYATGNKEVIDENFKLHNLKNIIAELFTSLGGLIFLFPIILFFGFKWAPRKSILVWLSFSAIVLLSIALIIKQQVYIDRNILPFLTSIVLITGVMLDHIIKYLYNKTSLKKKVNPAFLYVLVAVLIFLPIWGHSKGYINRILPNAKNNIKTTLEGINGKENRRLVTIDYEIEDDFGAFSSIEGLPSAIITNGKNFKSFLRNSIGSLETEDVVVISEIKNNKQLTTYLLPSLFNKNVQFGKYFVFYNNPPKPSKRLNLLKSFNSDRVKTVLKDSVSIREDLILREIKLDNDNRIYFKFDLLSVNDEGLNHCRIYFHGTAYEQNSQKLTEDRIKLGYEGWDFTVTSENSFKFGKSMYVVHEFQPTLKKYREFSFGIFRGCAKSEEFKVENVILSN